MVVGSPLLERWDSLLGQMVAVGNLCDESARIAQYTNNNDLKKHHIVEVFRVLEIEIGFGRPIFGGE